ncbi:MAG: hypothetical protein Q9225_007355 [Loekoesia sp. 1 TL-2023]
MTSSLKTHYGPRPTNTLSKVVVPSRHLFNGPFNSLPQSTGRQLKTITSAGDNLLWNSTEVDPDVFSINERRAKRRKLDPERNSQNTPHVLDKSDDEDQLGVDDIVKVRHIPTMPEIVIPIETKPLVHRESSQHAAHDSLWNIGVSEFRCVEKLTDSSLPNDKKRRDREKRRAHGKSGTPRSSFASSQSDSIELLDNESFRKPALKTRMQGTTNMRAPRDPQAVERRELGRSTGSCSPHFPISITARSIGDSKLVTSTTEDGAPRAGTRLRDQYRDTDGKTRSDVDPSSPDVLVTVGSNSRALSPIKTAHPQTTAEDPRQHSPSPSLIEEEPVEVQPTRSNIKPSSFTGIVKNETRTSSRTHQRDNLQEKPLRRSLPLYAYYFQGRIYKDDGLRLVYGESDGSFDIHHNGSNLAKVNPELRIQPKKLQKIFWAQGGKKMRFESSKSGKVDNILDVEMCHEKDIQILTEVLQESNAKFVKGEERSALDKKFEHRLEEHRKAIASARLSPSKHPDDILLTQQRLNRADKKRASEDHQDKKPKRPRIIDALGVDKQVNNTFQPRHGQPSKSNHFPKNHETVARDQSKIPYEDDLTTLDEMLKNSRLRSHNGGGSAPRNRDENLPYVFDDKVERYSKIHDMGRPWQKPLVYPKEGKKRTTVEWDDLERLDEGEFLNDNLIAFYLRYLECQAEKKDPTVSRKVHMFNTFFYERLTSTKPGHKGINYDAVRKWTRGVDLFTYDFVVVPVHESIHWYVAIICNLPALSRKLGGMDDDLGCDLASTSVHESEQHAKDSVLFSSSPQRDIDEIHEHETTTSFAEMSLEPKGGPTDKEDGGLQNLHASDTDQESLDNPDKLQGKGGGNDKTVEIEMSSKSKKGRRKSVPPVRKYDPYKPTILTFDSFGTPHSATVRILKQYLHEEAKDKRGQMEFDEKELQGVTAKDIPQQSNFYDCGLYLLGYIEKFLEDPRDFIDKVMRREWNIQSDWSRLDPSRMRSRIRTLLVRLHRDQRREGVNARRLKANPKSPNGPMPSRLTEGAPGPSKSNSIEGASDLLPKTAQEEKEQEKEQEKERELPSNKPTVEVPRETDEPNPQQALDAASDSPITATADKESVAEAPPQQPVPKEQPPQSFIVLDSQSQQANTTVPVKDSKTSQAPVMSPVLPSTIQDSQPQVAETPFEEVRESSPRASKKPRRIDSFSSPPVAPKTRSLKKSSARATKTTVTGTDPKVVIHIDD